MPKKSQSQSSTLDQKTLEKAAQMNVWSETGEAVTFGSLFEHQKTIVVFIRQSFCIGSHALILNRFLYFRPFPLWSEPVCQNIYRMECPDRFPNRCARPM